MAKSAASQHMTLQCVKADFGTLAEWGSRDVPRTGMEAANLRPNETMPSADGGSGQICPISYSPNSRKERLPTPHKSRIANADIGALEKHWR